MHLLDLQMSGLSGTELQSRLAELGNRLPIVFLTGHGDIATSVQTIQAGAEDFLTKPVAREEWLAAIRRAIVRCDELRRHDDWSTPWSRLPAYASRA